MAMPKRIKQQTRPASQPFAVPPSCSNSAQCYDAGIKIYSVTKRRRHKGRGHARATKRLTHSAASASGDDGTRAIFERAGRQDASEEGCEAVAAAGQVRRRWRDKQPRKKSACSKAMPWLMRPPFLFCLVLSRRTDADGATEVAGRRGRSLRVGA